MTLRKRVLSVLMAMLMVFSIVQIGVSALDINAGGNNENTGVMVDNGEGRYVLPQATLTATPVLRAASKTSGYGDYIYGSTIVKATPSGVPETSGNYALEAYAGEAPEWPTITFECDLSLANDKGSVTLESNVTGLETTVSNPTNNKWVWTITGGTIAYGNYADFTVTFNYTHTDALTGKTSSKQYKVYASSYVDKIAQPAGMYSEVNRTQSFHSDAEHGFVTRILGINTKGSYYELNGAGSGDNDSSKKGTYWAHGIYDFQTRQEIGWGNNATAYAGGLILYHKVNGDGGNDSNTSLDGNRPVSSTYIDTSKGTALNSASINLRYTTFDWKDVEGRHGNDEYDSYLAGYQVLPGEKSTSTNNDVAASNELNLNLEPSTKTYLKKDGNQYQTTNPNAIINADGKVYALSIPFKGTAYYNSDNMTTQADGTKYISYTLVNEPGIRYYSSGDGRMCDVTNAINLRFYLYNKADLRGAIEDATEAAAHIPQQTTYAAPQIGINPQEWYYSAGWSNYLTALKNAQRINAKYDVTQGDINTAIANLDSAVEGLVVATADYTTAQNLLTTIGDLDSNNYTDESWDAVTAAKLALGTQLNYTVFYQPLVDKLTADLQAAYDNLEIKDADFTRVHNAEAYAASFAPYDDYTAESVAALQSLLDLAASDEFLANKITNQTYVDEIANNIYDAADALALKGADYTEVNALVAEYNSMTADKDLYTTVTWNAYKNAVESVRYGCTLDQQALVDSMAAQITKAKGKLALKPADYTAVDAIVDEAFGLNQNDYTAASWANLMNALNAVEEGLTIDQQATVDAYVPAIRAAINALVLVDGDYTPVYDQITAFNNLDKSLYEQAGLDNVQAKIDAVVYGLKKDKQSQINAYASAIETAISQLVYKPADYTQAQIQMDRYTGLDRSLYKSSSLTAALTAYNNLNANQNLKINEQATVDSLTAALKTALDNLEYKDGNYTAVNAAITNADNLLAAADSYAAANNNNPYYTPASRAALETAIANVVTGLKINEQSRIDGFAAAINAAINGLQLNTADYTAVNAAKANVPADLDSGRYVAAKVTAVKNALNAVVENLLADEQTTVNGYAAAINAAVAALTLNGADYTCVTAAIAQKPADLSIYTAASVQNLNDKINAVVYDLTIDDQATVNGYAEAILQAIADLVPATADYTAVNTAKANAEAILNADATAKLYTDESKAAVTAAIAAIVPDLLIAEQARVDGFATAIDAAVAALAYKPIDASAFDTAKGTIPADLSIYTDASVAAVNAQIDAIDAFLAGDVDIRDQADLDAMVATLNTKIAALALKNADYTALNAVLAEFLAIEDPDAYSNYDDAYAVYAAAKSWKSKNGNLKIDSQSLIDAQTQLVRDAIDGLLPAVPAGYFQARDGSTTIIASNKQITGLKTELTKGQLTNTFLDYDGVTVTYEKAVDSARYYGTGSTVTVEYADGTVEVYTIVIYGDIDGNGQVDIEDVALVSLYLEDDTALNKVQQKAANVDGMRGISLDDLSAINLVAEGGEFNQEDPSL